MPVSNSDQDTGLPEVSLGFRRSLQAHSSILPRSDHVRFLPNPFHCVIHQTSHHRRCISKKKQDRQCTYNVPLQRVRVTIVTTENPLYCWHTYVAVNSIINMESFVMETQQCILLLRYICRGQQHETRLGLFVKCPILYPILSKFRFLDRFS